MSDKRLDDYALIPVRVNDKKGNVLGGRVDQWKHKDLIENRPNKTGQGLGLYYDMWLDMHSGFLLTYKKHPQFIVGLEAEGTDEVMISQLQRLPGTVYNPYKPNEWGEFEIRYRQPRGLRPLDWPKLAVGVVAQAAAQLNMASVGIRGARNIPSRASAISVKHATTIYDTNADRLSFDIDREGDWHKSVHELLPG